MVKGGIPPPEQITGAGLAIVGLAGAGLIVTFTVAVLSQPAAFLTVIR
jgi:hypothetical protein